MRPSLKQLEALYWVAKLGSFHGAAGRLHTTQSAISKRIAELESIAGEPLFDRSRRTARLTIHGRRLADEAGRIIALCDGLFDSPNNTAERQEVFRLGASELIAMTWLPLFIEEVQTRCPELMLDVDVNHGGRLVGGLNEGQFDLVLLPGPMWSASYEAVPLLPLARTWLASPALNIPARSLALHELSQFAILSQYRDTVHTRLQASWLHRHGVRLPARLRAHSFPVLGEMVRAGLGVAHLPELYYQNDIRDGYMRKLRVFPALPNIKYFAVYSSEQAHPLAVELSRVARECCDFSLRAGGKNRMPLIPSRLEFH